MSKKFTQLPVSTTHAEADVLAIVTDSDTHQISIGKFLGVQHPADTTWDDLRIPATQFKQGATSKPDFDFTNVGYLFDPSSNEEVYMTCQMPHNWAEGTNIKPHVHWITAASGVVVWRLEYRWTNVGELIPGSFTATTASVPLFSWSTSSLHNITAFTDINGDGKTLSSMLQIKLTRLAEDGADTYGSEALALEFDIHYQIDSIGSAQEYVK